MVKKLKISVLFIVYCIVSANISAQSPDSTGSFADFLFQSHNYSSALVEYERLIFFHTKSDQIALWYYRLGTCMKQCGDCSGAQAAFSHLQKDSPLYDSSALVKADCALLRGKPGEVDSVLQGVHSGQSNILRGYARIVLGEYKTAVSHFSAIPPHDFLYAKAQSLCLLSDSLSTFKPKKYLTAGLISLVPGMGHLYTGQYNEGIYIFSIIASFVGITAYYQHFKSERRAAIAATAAGIFYLGNIYGALVSVKIYNRSAKEKRIRRIQALYLD